MWAVLAVSLLIVVLSVVFRHHGSDSSATGPTRVRDVTTAATATPPPAATTAPTPGPTRSATPTATATTASPNAGMSGLGDAVKMSGWNGTLPPGLAGSGGSASLPKIRIHLEVYSAQPIGIVGYQVPTSLTDSSGTVKGVGTRWSLDTIGYGRPDYARLFFGSGPSGTPVTCIIRINGKVTEKRSTDGPYGRTMCQG